MTLATTANTGVARCVYRTMEQFNSFSVDTVSVTLFYQPLPILVKTLYLLSSISMLYRGLLLDKYSPGY